MWAEEKGEAQDEAVKGEDLRNVGLTGGGIAGDIAGQTEATPEEPEVGEADTELDVGGDVDEE